MENLVKTYDGSNTLFSKKYKQHFHDVRTGAVKEALTKHIIPSFEYHKKYNKKSLKILDICFGLGYNTLATIYYIRKNSLDIKIQLYSPELDFKLINSLKEFEYPQEFEELKPIIQELCTNRVYKNESLNIDLFIGDAREYIKTLDEIDIVYQDAFSSEVNSELWSVEYFKDIYNATSKDCIITTYSIATNVRLSLYEAGFEIYEINPTGKRKQSLALKHKQELEAKYIDMELKKERNSQARAIYDK